MSLIFLRSVQSTHIYAACPFIMYHMNVVCVDLDALSHKVRTYKEYHSVRPSSELGLPPTPHPQASLPPPPCFWGEGNTRWRERGWESSNSDEGHTLLYSLYVRTLCSQQFSMPLIISLGLDMGGGGGATCLFLRRFLMDGSGRGKRD
jgi:hypothetical protein